MLSTLKTPFYPQKKPPEQIRGLLKQEAKFLDPAELPGSMGRNVAHKITYGAKLNFIGNGDLELFFNFQDYIHHIQVVEPEIAAQIRVFPEVRRFQGFGFANDPNHFRCDPIGFMR